MDANGDGFYDDAGPVIMDAFWTPIANAVMSPVFTGSLLGSLNQVSRLGFAIRSRLGFAIRSRPQAAAPHNRSGPRS